jgi:hypothetical protein
MEPGIGQAYLNHTWTTGQATGSDQWDLVLGDLRSLLSWSRKIVEWLTP